MINKKKWTKLKYTLKHKVAFLKTEKEITGKYSMNGLFHDMDKVFLFIFSTKDVKEIQKKHRETKKHHVDNDLIKEEKDYIQMIIDWECARITKPDKPLNAYDTLHSIHPKVKSQVTPLLIKYKLNYSNVGATYED